MADTLLCSRSCCLCGLVTLCGGWSTFCPCSDTSILILFLYIMLWQDESEKPVGVVTCTDVLRKVLEATDP